MDKESLSLRKFNQYIFLGQLVSSGQLILGYFFINEKQDNILQIVGWLFIVMGVVFIFIFSHSKQRLLWIYKNTSPTLMQMKIEKIDDSDATNYFAYLTRLEENSSERWEAKLYAPSFDVEFFLSSENQVEVFVDPKNNNPAVIRTTKGLLWVMAGSGSVQNLEKSK